MNRPVIKKLSVELANLIAAGEVVERPASVVKELVENSIDAQASVIRIDLMDYGLKKISILDNGIGMTSEDIDLAVMPHATSKIAKADDLFSISTLGFRGEALPSIGSVSKMQITSSIDGYHGICKGYQAGVNVYTKEVSFAKGTQIEVSDLFYNTPARLKHLSSNQLELSHIVGFINRVALANPSISFILTNNGKVLFSTTGDADYQMIIRSIYGQEVAKNMISFRGENGLYKIKGFTSSNSAMRSNKNAITLIINGRIIKNLSLVYAITDAYKTYLPVGKYPITVLFIEADENLVDVNVHPTKQEVRFTDEFSLKTLITKSIQDALESVELVFQQTVQPTTVEVKQESSKKVSFVQEESKPKKEEPVLSSYEWEDFPNAKPFIIDNDEPTEDIEEEKVEKNNMVNNVVEETTEFQYQLDTYPEKREIDYQKDQVEMQTLPLRDEVNTFFSSMKYLGQYNKTYLLLEKEDDLYLLDQHAGMERYMYELISQKFHDDLVSTSELLVPLKIEVPLYEIDLVLSKKDEFAKIGISFEHFGTNTLLIREVPTWIPEYAQVEMVNDIINYLIHNQKVSKDILFDNLAKMLSCKKSIKANMGITTLEVQTLLAKLDQCKNPFTCPHGRPTIIKFTKYEIEKLFKRVI